MVSYLKFTSSVKSFLKDFAFLQRRTCIKPPEILWKIEYVIFLFDFLVRDRPFDFLGGCGGGGGWFFFSRFSFYFLPIENQRFFFTV